MGLVSVAVPVVVSISTASCYVTVGLIESISMIHLISIFVVGFLPGHEFIY